MGRGYLSPQVYLILILTLLICQVGRSSAQSKKEKKGLSGSALEAAGAGAPSQACWMKVDDFLTTFVGPQGWEGQEPVYAAQSECRKKEKCVGIKKFQPFNKSTTLEGWKDNKILYYPPGQLSWIDLQEKPKGGKPLILRENSKGRRTYLCRYISEVSPDQLILGTYYKGEDKCMVEAKGKSKGRAPFQTLVINSAGKSEGLERNVEDCPPKKPKACKEDPSKHAGRTFITPPKAPATPVERDENELDDDDLCWLDYSNGLNGPGNKFNASFLGAPLGQERGDNVYLARVIWGDKLNTHVAFGKYISSEHMLYIIGCEKPDAVKDRLHVEFLFAPSGTIDWIKTNQTRIAARPGFPSNVMVVGRLPGNPYALSKRGTCYSICQPDCQKEFVNEVPLGIVDSNTGYCESVFRGRLVRYSEFWIPIDQHVGKFRRIGSCNKRQRLDFWSLSSVPIEEVPGLYYSSGEFDQENDMLTFDGYSIPNPGFTQTGFDDDIYIESCTTWAANPEWTESRQ